MKILISLVTRDPSGGSSISALQLIRELRSRGHEPIMTIPDAGEFAAIFDEEKYTYYIVKADWWLHPLGLGYGFHELTEENLEAIAQFVDIIEKEKPSFALINTIVSPWLAYAAKLCGVPHACYLHETIDDAALWDTRLPWGDMLSAIDAGTIRWLANSEFTKRKLSEHMIQDDRIDIVYPYAVEEGEIISRSAGEFIRKNDRLTIVYVSYVTEIKNQLTVVEAARILRERGMDFELYLVGGVDESLAYYKQIEQLIVDHCLHDYITFTDFDENALKYVKGADIALACGTHESFGMVAVEAMAVGTPLIAARARGLVEIVGEDEERAWFYQSAADLADQIMFVSAHKDQAIKKALAAKNYVSEKFTKENNLRPLFAYIDSLPEAADSGIALGKDIASLVRLQGAQAALKQSDISKESEAKSGEIAGLQNAITMKEQRIGEVEAELARIQGSRLFRMAKIPYRILRFPYKCCRALISRGRSPVVTKEVQPPAKKVIDFLIFYEHWQRELYGVSLLRAELEKRGYTAEFARGSIMFITHCPEAFFYDAKVVVYHAVYGNRELRRALWYGDTATKVVNLQAEQVFSEFSLNDGLHKTAEEALNAHHVAWGSTSAERYREWGVKDENVFETGSISLDIVGDRIDRLLIPKDELAEKYNLNKDAQWVIFYSSFSATTLSSQEIAHWDSILKGGFPTFRKAAAKSKTKTLQWFRSYLNTHSDIELIYRAHPSERDDAKVLELQEQYPNFRIINDYTAAHWIYTCDKILTWISTSIAEAFLLNKPVAILRPHHLPRVFDSELMRDSEKIETYAGFIDFLEEGKNAADIDADVFRSLYGCSGDGFAHRRLSDALEGVLKGKASHTYSEELIERLDFAEVEPDYRKRLLTMWGLKTGEALPGCDYEPGWDPLTDEYAESLRRENEVKVLID